MSQEALYSGEHSLDCVCTDADPIGLIATPLHKFAAAVYHCFVRKMLVFIKKIVAFVTICPNKRTRGNVPLDDFLESFHVAPLDGNEE